MGEKAPKYRSGRVVLRTNEAKTKPNESQESGDSPEKDSGEARRLETEFSSEMDSERGVRSQEADGVEMGRYLHGRPRPQSRGKHRALQATRMRCDCAVGKHSARLVRLGFARYTPLALAFATVR